MSFLDRNLEEILNNLWEGAYIIDENRIILFWNKGAYRISGYSSEEVIGKSCQDNILMHVSEDGTSLCKNKCPVLDTFRTGETQVKDVYLQHKKGHRVGVKLITMPLMDKDNNKKYVLELFQENYDNYFILNHFQDLVKGSLLDPLTELPNRRYLLSKLEENFSLFKRYNLPFGVLFLDIDNFKKINDTFGHKKGDEVLKIVAATLKTSARKGEIFGRFGGEEFVGILIVRNLEEIRLAAERVRVLIENSKVKEANLEIRFTVSIGATLVNKEDDLETLLERADKLMYEAKKQGKNRVVASF